MFSPRIYLFFICLVYYQKFSVCLDESENNQPFVDSHGDRLTDLLLRQPRDTESVDTGADDGGSDISAEPESLANPYCLQGPPGRDGRDGRDGGCSIDFDTDFSGIKGEKGEPGNDGIPGSLGDSTIIKAMYIRWGRKTCPDTAELIYEGLVGGSGYHEVGGGAEYLCLPLEPIYDKTEPGVNDGRAYMYGAEYQLSDAFGVYEVLYDHNVPCALCLARSRDIALTVPARNICPSDEWTLEYSGYLMSDRHKYHSTKFICVDKGAESRDGTYTNENGALLYFVEGRCGSLPCDPYVEGSELTCAVCTL